MNQLPITEDESTNDGENWPTNRNGVHIKRGKYHG